MNQKPGTINQKTKMRPCLPLLIVSHSTSPEPVEEPVLSLSKNLSGMVLSEKASGSRRDKRINRGV